MRYGTHLRYWPSPRNSTQVATSAVSQVAGCFLIKPSSNAPCRSRGAADIGRTRVPAAAAAVAPALGSAPSRTFDNRDAPGAGARTAPSFQSPLSVAAATPPGFELRTEGERGGRPLAAIELASAASSGASAGNRRKMEP
ncbi:hypothetical protein Vretifemale_10095, partial [Volvox reticuliferus]